MRCDVGEVTESLENELCTVLPLDGLTGRWLDFRHNTHRLVLFELLCLQQVERVITVSTKTCYDKYTKYNCVQKEWADSWWLQM